MGIFFSIFDTSVDLYEVEARELDKFIHDRLQPDEAFLRQVRNAIHIVCEFLKARCFSDASCPIDPRPRVLKVVKGGSSGKGTALKGGSDADLVVFLDIFRGYRDQERERSKIIREIERRLRECQQLLNSDVCIERTKYKNPRVLTFKLQSYSSDDSIEFDVLPAFNALGHYRNGSRPDPQVYLDLIRSSRGQGSQFSPCFTELQRDFVRDRPPKLKNLIRLVKHWYKQLPGRKSLPPKYALELLAVYAWEHGSHGNYFDMAEGFRTVLWLLQQYKQLCIFWTRFYDFENRELRQFLQSQLRKSSCKYPGKRTPAAPSCEGIPFSLTIGLRFVGVLGRAPYLVSQVISVKRDGGIS
ncbi:2'-5'-oligoadenylate synthase 1-like isoform X2 [Varanus komodoensis]|uniref:2'-5'-oligoadenylate synthase 1-like isoform X2 n=1 Tax=Varanus komodoensis TaxID=61221 RepID=UPI001CF76E84|nr:2'-5'-oligoadenylate synthase 1-like isoform X2 [Varanus komodoensis]